MSKFGVTPTKEAELLARMAACGLTETDLDERHIRSGGPGGQHVNRSATCVYLKHRPTGLEVKMQREWSQALNRFFARRRMCELIEAQLGTGTADQKRDDARRRKAKRRSRAKKKYSADADTSSDAVKK